MPEPLPEPTVNEIRYALLSAPERPLLNKFYRGAGSAMRASAKGEAWVNVPINDALTSFRLVAVAGSGLSRFGTGSATIRVTQDLQMLSGLPPLVRELLARAQRLPGNAGQRAIGRRHQHARGGEDRAQQRRRSPCRIMRETRYRACQQNQCNHRGEESRSPQTP